MCQNLSPVTPAWRALKNATKLAKIHGGAVSNSVTVTDLNPKVAANAVKDERGHEALKRNVITRKTHSGSKR